MSLESRISLNDQISQEAAEWLVEFRTGDIDPAGRRDFDAWLRASPEHIRAFIEMAALWHEGGAIDPRRRLDVEAIVARARSEENITALTAATGAGATVSMLPVDRAPTSTAAHAAAADVGRPRASAAPWAVAASLLVVLFSTALLLHSGRPGLPSYATAVRARRSIVFPDGSKALLDSKSRLQVSYTAATRTVELLQGQALFYVVRNPRRPFVVHAGHTVVRDVGTAFDVNRLADGTVVTVVEGRVAVATRSQPIYLSAGEQLDVRLGDFSPRPIHVDISSEIAWTHGEVVLESATLAEVAQLFNRYSTRRLVAQDLGTKPLRLSGVFSTDPGFLMRYLRGRPDIAVTETDSEIDIVRRQSAPALPHPRHIAAAPPPPSANARSSDAAPAQLGRVTIEAGKERQALRRQVDHYVTSVIVQPWGDALDRWNIPICPLVAGLPKAFGELILERISQAAVDAHAPLAGRVCHPNLFVVAHDDVARLVKKWWARDRTTFDFNDQGIEAVYQFFRSERPIRAWYNLSWEDSGGAACPPAASAAALGTGLPQNLDAPACTNGVDSRLMRSSTGSNIASAIVVVDMSRMKAMTTRQLADYIALIGLADVRLDADPNPVPSILELFGHGPPPRGLTRWDRALLYSLYSTSQAEKLQVSEMESTMVKRIAP